MLKRIVLGVVLLGSVAAITVAGMRPRPPKPIEVELAKVVRESITRTVSAAGKIQSATTVKLSSNLSGDLVELNVKAGDRVTRGQVLARIDPTRYRAQAKSAAAALSAAQADLNVEKVAVAHAQAELDRVVGLNGKGLASAAEVEQVRAALEGEKAKQDSAGERVAQAQAELDAAKDFLAKTVLTSPIDGEVIELDRELGERVRGSDFSEDVVMVLAALSRMEVKLEVGEHDVVFLRSGEKAEVQVDALEGAHFSGQVVEVGQNAIVRNAGTEAEVTTFPIRVALDERPPGALPGMSATVGIATETHASALVVPIQCVTVRPEKALARSAGPSETQLTAGDARGELAKVVFRISGGKAELRRVKTGLSSETGMEILEGLQEGDEVVEGPYRTLAKELKDGDRVEQAKPDGTGKS